MTATTINRTPFREMKDIPLVLGTSTLLRWETCCGNEAVFTSDGTRYAVIADGKLGNWWKAGGVTGIPLRPLGMTWEAAEALVNPPSPQPPPQPEAEEPFRPGLPPAELRAVCKEWEWRCDGGVRATDFVGDCHRFLDICKNGRRRTPQEMSESAIPLVVCNLDHFRPLGRTWADVEAAAKAAKATAAQLPKDGDEITVASAVAVVKEGRCQALDELLPSYETLGTLPKTRPVFTVITSLPRCRRKYVKIFLKSLGFRNVDKIPTTTEQKPYYMSLLSTENREKLISLAPGIVLRDVL